MFKEKKKMMTVNRKSFRTAVLAVTAALAVPALAAAAPQEPAP